MGLRDELHKAIAADEARQSSPIEATEDTWLAYFRANKWTCLGIVLMFVVILIGMGAVWK